MGSSKKLYGRELVKYKKSLDLNKSQRDVLLGSILGDANVRMLKKQAFLTFSHNEKQVDYVFWKYKNFRDWVLTKPREEIRKYYKDSRRSLVSWRFSTISHPLLTEYYWLFYPKGKKIIPKSIDSFLNSPLSLAVWYMDDGSKSRSSCYLNTQQFQQIDQEWLVTLLWRSFRIEGRLNWDKQYQRIRVTTEGTRIMHRLIEPFVLPCFRYKLCHDPVTTDPKGEIPQLVG